MNPNSLCHRKIPNFLSRYISSNSLTYCVPTSKFVPGIVGPNLQGLYASVLRHSLQGLEGILLDSHKQKLMIFMSFETNYLSGLYAICFHEETQLQSVSHSLKTKSYSEPVGGRRQRSHQTSARRSRLSPHSIASLLTCPVTLSSHPHCYVK
ncbi:hypothetical protein D0Y65_034015 [Glycine soja]|uniref:Uncharacterized protein n=1 Tax=Glycine soja TaxID=3848 RepID=A0A445HNL3_GLYSO|nr:hypothetical protein D0Y65_034015 [Glycine soja]